MSAGAQVGGSDLTAAKNAAGRAAELLLKLQREDGSWRAKGVASPLLESEWFILQLWLHPPRGGRWAPPGGNLAECAAQALLHAVETGGAYGPSDDVKAYFALKLAGESANGPAMVALRQRILDAGGSARADHHTRILLSLFGLFPRKKTLSVTPELLLFPGGSWPRTPNWLRAILGPLSILQSVTAQAPQPVPAGFSLDELCCVDRPLDSDGGQGIRWERFIPGAVRSRALGRLKGWLLSSAERGDARGWSFPALQYTLMAMDALGVGPQSVERQSVERALENLVVEDDGCFLIEPGPAAARDTAIAISALRESGHHDPLEKATRWLIEHGPVPAGGARGGSGCQPPADDAAFRLRALHCSSMERETAPAQVARQLVQYLEETQSPNGGWTFLGPGIQAARWVRTLFGDRYASLGGECCAITGCAMEALRASGMSGDSPSLRRAVGFLRQSQEVEGSWASQSSGSYLHGTCMALRGLRATGMDDREAEVLRGGEWLRSVQNADGGWGEAEAGGAGGAHREAGSSPLHTAWAVLGLIAGGDRTSESVRRGVKYLAETQRPEGGWDGMAPVRGLPPVFRMTRHLDHIAYPLLALAAYQNHREGAQRGV